MQGLNSTLPGALVTAVTKRLKKDIEKFERNEQRNAAYASGFDKCKSFEQSLD